MKLLRIAFAGAALAAGGAAAAQEDAQAEANRAFAVYPAASLAAGEQGTVRYRVKIDRRGKPRQCEVIESSGHSRLDLATCQMLMERARFTPKGSRTTHEGKVTWRLG